MRCFIRSNVYLIDISIGLIFFPCLHIKKYEKATVCSRQGVRRYECHTVVMKFIFFLMLIISAYFAYLCDRGTDKQAPEFFIIF